MRIPHFSGDVYLCRLKKTDIIMITTSRFFKEKQYMWYKVRELQSKGLNKTQIGKHLGVDRSTVRKYLQMSREDFVRRRNSHRKYTLKLAGYEEYVRGLWRNIRTYRPHGCMTGLENAIRISRKCATRPYSIL